jgi:hypothetical protein
VAIAKIPSAFFMVRLDKFVKMTHLKNKRISLLSEFRRPNSPFPPIRQASLRRDIGRGAYKPLLAKVFSDENRIPG